VEGTEVIAKLLGKADVPMYALQVNHTGEWSDTGWFDPARLEQVQAATPAVAKTYRGGLHAPVLRIVLVGKTERVLHMWNARDGWSRA